MINKDRSAIPPRKRHGGSVLGRFVDALDQSSATERVLYWANDRRAGYVCLYNAHSAVTALDDPDLAAALDEASMVLPDGAPIAWMLRRKGFPSQQRVAGPDLMLHLCKALENTGHRVFLFGSTPKTLERLSRNLRERFPDLSIAGTLSPRFGTWSEEEQAGYIQAINDSGAEIIFVGLGCPKQEIWMHEQHRHVHGVLLGGGAAFDFHAGTIARAPKIFQTLGLEWLHRLASEPHRLWKRYLYTNTRFILHASRELLGFARP